MRSVREHIQRLDLFYFISARQQYFSVMFLRSWIARNIDYSFGFCLYYLLNYFFMDAWAGRVENYYIAVQFPLFDNIFDTTTYCRIVVDPV